MKSSTSEFLTIRGLKGHVCLWGPADAPKLFLLHGWMDCSASFQFLVDAFSRDWRVIAPDWRGFGRSEWLNHPYWFPDYLADLDRLLDHYSPDEPARLVGHSMGANVAMIYAGVRPERVRALVNLEGFGLPSAGPGEAPARYARWLAELGEPQRFRDYASFDALAERLCASNARLAPERARFLAQHWGKSLPDGRVTLRSDPAHKRVNPVLYRLEEAEACWRNVAAPVLWVEGAESESLQRLRRDRPSYDARLRCFATLRVHTVPDAGHMLHHDQPHALARIVEDFLRR